MRYGAISRSCLSTALILSAAPASGWWVDGHAVHTEAAVLSLPASMPSFFRGSADVIAHFSADPDLAKNPGLSLLREKERPEHYLDLELLEGQTPPDTRGGFVRLCNQLRVEPSRVGFAVYAISEWAERLALAFAEYRKWPSAALQYKCLVYAGLLAHYAQDLCQPLHTTIHFDGRVNGGDESPLGDKSPHSGIHENVDSLIGKLDMKPEDIVGAGLEPGTFPALMPAILTQLENSHSMVGDVYDLESELQSATSSRVREFALERSRVSSRFTAALFLTAWRQSDSIKLPAWLKPPDPGSIGADVYSQ